MKKVFIVLFCLVTFLQEKSLFAQDLTPKYYSSVLDGDYNSGYSGVAAAIYIESSEVQEIRKNASSMPGARSIDKLTKNNSWLVWKALGEWDYLPGEIYMIVCADSAWANSAVILIATISSNGKSFDWWGWSVNQ
jgi:hypothetical protein